MKQILGKIFLLFISFGFLLATPVSIEVEKVAIYKGDIARFSISASGKDIVFPQIDSVGGYEILGSSTSSMTQIINSKISYKKSKTYSFRPLKSVVIPSFKVIVDGKEYRTREIKIDVVKPTQNKNAQFLLQLKVNKTTARVGEAIKLDIIFKQKINANISKLNINKPKIENFWIKKLSGTKKKHEGDFITQTISYIIFPQKAGDFTINSIEADIGRVVRSRDPFFNDPFFNAFSQTIRWQKIFSNELNIHVLPLPNNLEVYGDFDIEANVDKTKVRANKPVNLTITIKGQGNIEDIKKFSIDLEDAIVYADKPVIHSQMINDEEVGAFSQKIAIISDKSFTIPSISFSFFSKKEQKIKTIKTKPIYIKVIGGAKQSQEKVTLEQGDIKTPKQAPKQKIVYQKELWYLKYIFLIFGIVAGFVAKIFFDRLKTTPKEEPPIIKKIKKAKNDKELFEVLLPIANENNQIKEILNQLEENIYQGKKHKINKKEIILKLG